MAPKYKDGDVALSFSAKWVSWAHTVVAYAAFLGALFTGISLHYHKIVQNEYYVSCRIRDSAARQLTPAAGLPTRMVSIRLLHYWGPVPGAIGLHGLYSYHLR